MTALVAAAGWLLALAGVWAAVAARKAADRRMELVARAGHELRGPLTAVRLGLHLAGQGAGPATERLRGVDLELEQAGRALDDLAAARDGRLGPDRPEPVDVMELVRTAAAAWRPVARASGTELRCEGFLRGVEVHGDRLRLAQAFGNLIANALEHGAGPVAVRGRVTASRVRIEVADRGPGLPAPVTELVRGGRAGRGVRGRGLSIAADIAARHGGRLAAAPADRGARLALELPLVAAPR